MECAGTHLAYVEPAVKNASKVRARDIGDGLTGKWVVQDIVAIDADGESLGLRQLERLADIGIQPPYSGKEYHARPLVALVPRQSSLEERYAPGVRGRIGENRSRRAFRNNLRQPVQRTTVLKCTEARAVDRCNVVCTLRISERHIRTGEPIDGPAVYWVRSTGNPQWD